MKRYSSWSDFPKYVTNKILKQVISKTTTVDQSVADSDPETIIWFRLQFDYHCFWFQFCYCNKASNTKLTSEFFCISKDKTPFLTMLLLCICSIVKDDVLKRVHYMNVVLDILGLIKAVQFGQISIT